MRFHITHMYLIFSQRLIDWGSFSIWFLYFRYIVLQINFCNFLKLEYFPNSMRFPGSFWFLHFYTTAQKWPSCKKFNSLVSFLRNISCTACVPVSENRCFLYFAQCPSCLWIKVNSRLCYSLMAKSRNILLFKHDFLLCLWFHFSCF